MVPVLDSLSVTLTLTLACVLIASAVGKFRAPDDLDGWTSLGVPDALRRQWLLRLHPWGELVLGLALALLGGVLGVLAGLVAVLLMGAYTWLVVAAYRRPADASCACFGDRRRITGVTVVRNLWLTVLALGATATVWTLPLLGGALREGVGDGGGEIEALVAAAVTTALVLWPEARTGDSATAGLDDDLDYLRIRTPAVPVTLADGTVRTLRDLASTRPVLLLAVSPTCGACRPVTERAPSWRALLPEVDVRLLLTEPPESSAYTESDEPQSLHDPDRYVSGSIGEWGTPTAVLLGADGMLAGGPVTGSNDIAEFVGDVYESLNGERPPT